MAGNDSLDPSRDRGHDFERDRDRFLDEVGRNLRDGHGYGQMTTSPPWTSKSREESIPDRGFQDSIPDRGRSFVDPPVDGFFKAPILPQEHPQAQRAFEHVQTELLIQSRRQDEIFGYIAKVEADLSRVAKVMVENEGLHAAERQQKQQAITSVTRRTEEALLMCESLRHGQEQLLQKVESLEALVEEGTSAAEECRLLRREVDSLQATLREKTDVSGHALRRLDAMEQIFDDNTKLRQEVGQLRRAGERRDLEMAAMQGQIDALTKLVREQLGHGDGS